MEVFYSAYKKMNKLITILIYIYLKAVAKGVNNRRVIEYYGH